jgi:hypothetical protein
LQRLQKQLIGFDGLITGWKTARLFPKRVGGGKSVLDGEASADQNGRGPVIYLNINVLGLGSR